MLMLHIYSSEKRNIKSEYERAIGEIRNIYQYLQALDSEQQSLDLNHVHSPVNQLASVLFQSKNVETFKCLPL